MTVAVLRGDARQLPLPDGCVDLVVTSPPYFGLRSYTDGGAHYGGQIGSEATPREWLANLVACTAEWVRVLKPSGSIFVNLGDKYSGNHGTDRSRFDPERYKTWSGEKWRSVVPAPEVQDGGRPKSLLGLPWRYAIACTDQLGLILRRDIIWAKPNGLPESVTDRCRSSHEYVFHLVQQPRYYSAVDEIREGYAPETAARYAAGYNPRKRADAARLSVNTTLGGFTPDQNPLGKLPGSVWDIPSQPLTVPAHLGIDHFAAFPMELPRRIIAGWSPPGICTACGEGRRPVTSVTNIEDRKGRKQRIVDLAMDGAHGPDGRGGERWKQTVGITGYACACTPFHWQEDDDGITRWKVYHFDRWTPPPTTPALVLDPFAGTGTTMLVAAALGRTGIGVDRSADYCRLAAWRTTDRGEIARAMEVPKPLPVVDGQEALFSV
jgi:DNA modification methylase